MSKIRVLVVDDHAIMRDGLRAVLTYQEDIEVVGEARDGEEAILRARELSPDIVLMDIAMPRKNGIAATTVIKSEFPSTKVVILSQHDDPQYLMPVLDAGASGYVLKRSPGPDLVAAIRSVHQGETYLYPSLTSAVIRELRQTAGREASQDVALTPRETEILKLIARGFSNTEIADMLVLSFKTVDWHRTNLMAKLGVHSAVELTRYALRRHMVSAED